MFAITFISTITSPPKKSRWLERIEARILMRKISAIFCCALALAGLVRGAETKADLPVKFPEDVQVEQGVVFLGEGRTEKADLYFPSKISPGAQLPAIIVIHGGGWNDGVRNGKREINIGTTLARNGYIAMSIDYLLAHGKYAVWPTNLYDCKNAVRWLRQNAARLKIDPDRIGVMGGSAGGHLASMVALTEVADDLEPTEPYPGISDAVDCCVDMYGIADLTSYEPHAAMLGKKLSEAPELYRLASPVTYVRGNSPPFLILHGTADKTVSPHQSELFAAALQKAGVEHKLVWIDGAPHSFTLQPTQQDLRPLVLEFFDRHLKKTNVSSQVLSKAAGDNPTH
jgi:acetyl esterase/lipase